MRSPALERSGGGVAGVRCRVDGEDIEIGRRGGCAAGGFEANPQMRAAHLGPNWDIAKVRGTPYNTGEGLEAMVSAGAMPYGHWSGCHASPGTRARRRPATAS